MQAPSCLGGARGGRCQRGAPRAASLSPLSLPRTLSLSASSSLTRAAAASVSSTAARRARGGAARPEVEAAAAPEASGTASEARRRRQRSAAAPRPAMAASRARVCERVLASAAPSPPHNPLPRARTVHAWPAATDRHHEVGAPPPVPLRARARACPQRPAPRPALGPPRAARLGRLALVARHGARGDGVMRGEGGRRRGGVGGMPGREAPSARAAPPWSVADPRLDRGRGCGRRARAWTASAARRLTPAARWRPPARPAPPPAGVPRAAAPAARWPQPR